MGGFVESARQKSSFAFIFLFSVIAILAMSSSADATVKPNGKIAFVSYRDGNAEIYTVNPDRSGLTRITNSPAVEQSPAFSPDGSKIAFSSNRNGTNKIYVLRLSDMSISQLTFGSNYDDSPTWSPDGSRIAFTRTFGIVGFGVQKLYVMNSDGSELNQLTNNSGTYENPAWSPDGSRIAFNANSGTYGIFFINPDGGNQTALNVYGWPASFNSMPSWAPDSSKIACYVYFNANDSGIYTMKPDGTQPQPVITRTWTWSPFYSQPAWSPDGTSIAFIQKDNSNNCTLCTARATGGGCYNIADLGHPFYERITPSWGPLVLQAQNISPSGWLRTTSQAIEADLTDNGSGIDSSSVAVYIDDTSAPGCSLVGAHLSCSTSDFSAGWHSLTISYETNDGTPGLSDSPFGVDLAPPAISEAIPPVWSGSATVIGATLSDQQSGPDSSASAVYLDGSSQPLTNCDISDSSLLRCQASGLSDGHHDFLIVGRDKAGNSATLNGSFEVETTKPEIGGTSPSGNVWASTAIINASYTDSKSGVNPNSVKLTVNGIVVTSRATISVDQVSYFNPNCGIQNVHLEVSDVVGNTQTADWSYSTPMHYYFPWYDNIYGHTWLLAAQMPGSGTNIVDFWMKTNSLEQGIGVNDGETQFRSYDKRLGGPIKIMSQYGNGISSERSLFGNSFEEVWSTSYDDLDTHYYWPVYLGSMTSEWVLVANPAENGEAVEVDISIRNVEDINKIPVPDIYVNRHVIQPGDTWTPTWPYSGGPVEVKAYRVGGSPNNSADARKVVASERILMGDSFNEMAGIAASKLSNEYEWPWYDSQNANDLVIVGNPNSEPVYLFLYLHGQLMASSDGVPSGTTIWWDSSPQKLMDGPIEVKACFDTTEACYSPANIYTSQIVIYGPSYEETAGVPLNSLKPTANWTWYDEKSAGSLNWVLVANPNASAIYYEISVPGKLDPANPADPYYSTNHGVLAPGQRVTPRFPGIIGGPVQVRAWQWNGSSKENPANVLASQRVLWKGYFNELVGAGL
ncbi:MAG: PD40 domain-containing protein [Actinobacteria bacterium]|nr:PD40 domain-containing protein [Actinomycetota bacterium]